MQDGAVPNNDGLAEPQAIPLEDPNAEPQVITAGEPAATPPPGGQPPAQDTAEEHWKNEAIRNREAASRFQNFEGLIGFLEKNPDAVDQLEGIITGGATRLVASENLANQAPPGGEYIPSEEDQLALELGVAPAGGLQQAQKPMSAADIKAAEDRARAEGAATERAKLQFAEFQQELMTNGVPEHSVDEFVQFIRNPGALTYYDLFAAYNSNRVNVGKEPINLPPRQTPHVPQPPSPGMLQQGQPQGQPPQQQPQPPVPVQAMPGSPNRPDEANRYTNNEGLERAVPNPNEI